MNNFHVCDRTKAIHKVNILFSQEKRVFLPEEPGEQGKREREKKN